MKRLLNVTALLALGATVGWFLRPAIQASDSALTRAAHPIQDPAPSPTIKQLDQLAEPERRTLMSESVEPAAAEGIGAPKPKDRADVVSAFSGLEAQLYKHPHYDGSEVEFLEKYKDCSMEQMRCAMLMLDRRETLERSKIVEQRLRDGVFTTQVVPDGGRLPGPIGSSDGLPVAVGWQAEPSDGFVTYKVTQIPPEEYPDYRDLQVEAWWLATHLRRLGMPLDDLK